MTVSVTVVTTVVVVVPWTPPSGEWIETPLPSVAIEPMVNGCALVGPDRVALAERGLDLAGGLVSERRPRRSTGPGTGKRG